MTQSSALGPRHSTMRFGISIEASLERPVLRGKSRLRHRRALSGALRGQGAPKTCKLGEQHGYNAGEGEIPVKKIPSKVPVLPIEATGAPKPTSRRRFSKFAIVKTKGDDTGTAHVNACLPRSLYGCNSDATATPSWHMRC
jgi:hypothetical protein